MKITVVGMGYVGLSNAVLLARYHEVVLLDIVPEKVAALNAGKSPIHDVDIEAALVDKTLKLRATLDAQEAFESADYVIVATPTDFDTAINTFNTASVEAVIAQVLALAPQSILLIRSTVPVGFTQSMRDRYRVDTMVFMPEFLREGRALYDNLYPSRIVVGDVSERGRAVADMFSEAATARNIPTLLTGSTEAEAIKLFANSYLAMRVAFFNELDSYAAAKGLSARQIIEGVGLDTRIGTHYNNPSFGYGGYCLPKDTKQLLNHFGDISQKMFTAIVEANPTRMDFITHDLLRRGTTTVGIYRLVMKTGSDNFREASILGVMARLRKAGVRVLIYEPLIAADDTAYGEVTHDLASFKTTADIIVANRIAPELDDCTEKLYTRDIYGRD